MVSVAPRLPVRARGPSGVPKPPSGYRSVRRPAAVGIARLAAGIVGVAHHQGTALPGLAAERIWPDVLGALADQLRSTVLVVGTNGKTTTAGLIARIVSRTDGPPIANRSGANMRQGIVTSLVGAADLHGRLRDGQGHGRDAVFEVDELALERVLPVLGPSVIVATNLFRDQLDRYGEADAVVDRWITGLATAADGSILVYCADDPRLAMLAGETRLATLTFGLAGPPGDDDNAPPTGGSSADPVTCRSCDAQLGYTWRSVGHLGGYACPNGHVARNEPDVAVDWPPARRPGPGRGGDQTGTIRLGGRFGTAATRSVLPGLGNRYNVAAAVTAGLALGHDLARSAAVLDGMGGPFGRLEWLDIRGRHVVVALIKNTISLSETVRMAPDLGADVVLLGLNDAPADGRDVSWIWDAPVADLVADRVVVLCGSRAADLHLRLTCDPDVAADPPRSIVRSSSLEDALEIAVARAPLGGTVVAGATYTAMMGLRAIAERWGDAPPAPR